MVRGVGRGVLAGALALLAVTATPAFGQILFDWPVRASATPDALVQGAPALLWNPAGFAEARRERREVWVVHVDGPDASGVQGLAGAAVFDVRWLGRIGVAYQHLGIPDIARTTTSPEPEPGSLTVTEDLAVLSLAHGLAPRTGLGVSARLMRGTVGSDRKDRVSFDVGLQAGLGGTFQPAVGAVLRSMGTRSDLVVGLDAALPTPWQDRLELRAGYGGQSPLSELGLEHRLSLLALVASDLVGIPEIFGGSLVRDLRGIGEHLGALLGARLGGPLGLGGRTGLGALRKLLGRHTELLNRCPD